MTTETDNAENQARAQLASIVEMVAALEVDYDRLEELRDARKALREEFDAVPENDGVDFDNWVRNQVGFSTEEADELFALEAAAGDYTNQDDVDRDISEDPLEVSVRSGWQSPCDRLEPSEFRILLCTGGPAVQVVGDLGNFNEPHGEARIQYQDWFTPWKTLAGVSAEAQAALDTYCRHFYFGE